MSKKDLVILSINMSHNASTCLLINGEVVYNLESERISNIKYDTSPLPSIKESLKYTDHIDYVIQNLGLKEKNNQAKDFYFNVIKSLKKNYFNNKDNYLDYLEKHHLSHAANSFYSSGFDQAICIVKDGFGSDIYIKELGIYGKEIYSVYLASYPNNFKILQKIIMVPEKILKKEFLNKEILINSEEGQYKAVLTSSISEALLFSLVSLKFGFHELDAGKVMGMSSYGNYKNRNEILYTEEFINSKISTYKNSTDFLQGKNSYPKLNIENIDSFQDRSDFASLLQKSVEEQSINQIVEDLKKYNTNNICLSGGLFLNCVMNYKLLDFLPQNTNLYIDPISNDSGTSIGAAKYLHYELTKENKKYNKKNIYFGPQRNIDLDIFKDFDIKENVSEKEIAYLISKKNIIGLFQERSENGPRALGNRSILYDPRDPNGKDAVNIIKNREWFRPFAGSVLFEHVDEWFEMKTLKESPYMLFAVDVLKEKQDKIPAITHVDGTCRIQTVKEEDNKIFYNIIKEFYDLTHIPIVLNTSFNLAGDAIVELPKDALRVLMKSKLNYVYFPEKNILVSKKYNDTIS